MSLQAAGGSAQSTPPLLTHPSLPPSPVLVRGSVPEQPHKWLVDLTHGRLQCTVSPGREARRAKAVSATVQPQLHSHVVECCWCEGWWGVELLR